MQAQIPTTRNVIVIPTNELPSFNFIVGCINYNYVYCICLSFLKINNIFFKSFDNYSLRLVLKELSFVGHGSRTIIVENMAQNFAVGL